MSRSPSIWPKLKNPKGKRSSSIGCQTWSTRTPHPVPGGRDIFAPVVIRAVARRHTSAIGFASRRPPGAGRSGLDLCDALRNLTLPCNDIKFTTMIGSGVASSWTSSTPPPRRTARFRSSGFIRPKPFSARIPPITTIATLKTTAAITAVGSIGWLTDARLTSHANRHLTLMTL